MQQVNPPAQSKTISSLEQIGVQKSFYKFGVLNFESDKYISVRDKDQNGNEQLTIIEPTNNFNVYRKPNKSEAVLMHITQNIIALKAPAANGGHVLQIFNMDQKQKLKDITFNEKIIYWTWVSTKILAVVTATSVFHVNIENQNEQQKKIFDRFGALAGTQVNIIGYDLEVNEKWGALFGISTPDGGKTINGHIQLYLVESGKQQILEGHCCTFGQAYIHNADYKSQLFCFFERKVADGVPKITISEFVPPPAGMTKYKKICDFPIDQNFAGDFPVVMQVAEKYGMLYVVTKFGFLYIYELSNGILLFKNRISEAAVFTGAKDTQHDGLYVINKSGQIILTRIDAKSICPYLLNMQHINDRVSIAFSLASKYQLPGVDNMFQEQFQKCIAQGDVKGAATIAAQSPGTSLRNPQTIALFKGMQQQAGQPQPLMVYFSTLIEKSVLTADETLALAEPALSQGKTAIFQKYLGQNKITPTAQLGDLIKPRDIQLAIQIYKAANAHTQAGQAMIESGDMQGGQAYIQQNGGQVDCVGLIQQSLQSGQFDSALKMAKNFHAQKQIQNVHQIASIFQQFNRLQEMTSFLVQCMTENRPEDGPWQTQVLEFNLMTAPQVAEALFQTVNWNQYDRPKIGNLCESKQLFQLALQNYNDIKDIKRCVLNTHALNQEWLQIYLGQLQPEWCVECCQDLLRHNRQNMQIVVNVFQQNSEKIGFDKCISVFESVGAYEGIFYFLGAKINTIQDKDIYFKYIEAATKCNQLRVLESVIREKTEFYDPVKVKDFLKEMKLGDPKPLIFLCDIHGFVDELTSYLYQNEFNKYIETYLFKVNQGATPQVLGTLIDLECDENYIKQILYTIRGNCPIEPLIDEFDKRNKVRVLENWLESRVAEGIQLSAVHDALAKIKIDTNQDPEDFLTKNQFYDPKVIGKFCEDRDPHLAVIAYKRTWGSCDEELIAVTNKNALFRLQARYLVERQSKEIWAQVLDENNEHRQQVIDQIVQHALPESKSVDEVSTTVQAFMAADLPQQLISLLEKIVLHNSEFGQYKKLQNLLIITAIKSDNSRVMDYINRLDNYDSDEIAEIALKEEYGLFEEALVIYKKNDQSTKAMGVLLNSIKDIPRSAEFAEKTNTPEVWSLLGQSYLNNFEIVPAIDAFLKAKDHTKYMNIIQQAENESQYEKLIAFLTMARTQTKDVNIDNALAFAYAKCEQLTELEAFITGGNSVDAQKVGEKCYQNQLYEAAKILFVSVKNNAKIASCLVRLKQFQQAIDSAKKANTSKTWKELCLACVEAGEYRLASVSGMNLIIHPDHLEELISYYEEFGVQDEMMALLETGMGLERAHVGIYTELGILYAKYNPNKLMEHIKGYFQKINISKLLRVCERFQLWKEAVYLYSNYDEFDNAVNIMIEHSPVAFQHEQFCNLIVKGNSSDLYYRAITFYIEEQPMQLNDLLKHLTTKLDLSRTVSVMRKTGYLPLITEFLKSVQIQNVKEVNEALNEIFLEIEDYESLRKSVTEHETFDQAALAKNCEKHELLEFRRIGAFLYRRAKQYEFSINLSKQDQEYRDAIETAQESGKGELVENLLRFFVEEGEKEFFTVTCYTCFDLIKPDVVMELAWRAGLYEFAMPFFIQITRELTSKVDTVQKKSEQREQEAQKQAKAQSNKPLDIVQDMFNNTGMGMLPPSQPDMYNQGGMGQGMGQGGMGQGGMGQGMGYGNNMYQSQF